MNREPNNGGNFNELYPCGCRLRNVYYTDFFCERSQFSPRALAVLLASVRGFIRERLRVVCASARAETCERSR